MQGIPVDLEHPSSISTLLKYGATDEQSCEGLFKQSETWLIWSIARRQERVDYNVASDLSLSVQQGTYVFGHGSRAYLRRLQVIAKGHNAR